MFTLRQSTSMSRSTRKFALPVSRRALRGAGCSLKSEAPIERRRDVAGLQCAKEDFLRLLCRASNSNSPDAVTQLLLEPLPRALASLQRSVKSDRRHTLDRRRYSYRISSPRDGAY
jgi:hypothetical protein